MPRTPGPGGRKLQGNLCQVPLAGNAHCHGSTMDRLVVSGGIILSLLDLLTGYYVHNVYRS